MSKIPCHAHAPVQLVLLQSYCCNRYRSRPPGRAAAPAQVSVRWPEEVAINTPAPVGQVTGTSTYPYGADVVKQLRILMRAVSGPQGLHPLLTLRRTTMPCWQTSSHRIHEHTSLGELLLQRLPGCCQRPSVHGETWRLTRLELLEQQAYTEFNTTTTLLLLSI